MLPQLAILLAAAAILLLALHWFNRAKPAAAARTLKQAGLAALVLLGLWLLLTGKVAGLVAVAAGLAPWITRALRLHALWRTLRQFGIQMAGGRPSAGNVSQVRTRFLAMTLDHDSGALDGAVIEGRFEGRPLASLDFTQAVELWHDVQADPQSVAVLEAWLDRTWPDWREKVAPRHEQPHPPVTGTMSRDEAWEILGLQPGATPDEIKTAHRRLMRQVHPDHGGSTWLASRINQARDILLG